MRNYLYHGSKFDNKGMPLVPGIHHAGTETFWDGSYESNRFLYACNCAASAILLGMGSLAEKEVGTIGFKYDLINKEALFLFEEGKLINESQLKGKLKEVSTYLYTIRVDRAHGWVENQNTLNGIEGEYKTSGAVPDSDYVATEIKVLQWLTENNWTIKTRLRHE